MIKPPLSIYRGYSSAGIGELPGDVAGKTRGEQYLAADSELWRDPGLANAARKWMTLYDDQRITEISYRLGQSIEAWSYFGHGDLRFVVRMVSGGEFASRLAYFTHGQAWRVEEFFNGNDPGALLGQSEAFHPAWRQGQPIQPVAPMPPNTAVWRQILKTRTRAAIRLLAQLYRACVIGQPVVMGVPFREFVVGSSLHPLVSFARAALPLEIKRDCRIRVFTGQPESYLSGFGADLVVVPEELAASSLAARPDAALLDLNCELKSGPDADQAYAEAMVERVLKLPDMLLSCTGRLGLPKSRLPHVSEVAKVAPIYNLIAASGNHSLMDDLFDHFQKEAKTRSVALDWKGIIQPWDWKQFSQTKLIHLAFSQADSADLRALRKQTREELSARSLDLDGPAKAWIDSLDQTSRSQEIVDLVQARLLSRDLCVALLRGISPHGLSQLLDNPEMTGIVAEILCQSEISEEAAAHLTEDADHVRSIIMVARDLPAYRRAADIMIKSLACRKNLPDGLTEADLLALEPPDANAQLESYLHWAEVLELAGSDHARHWIARLGNELKGREIRLKVFELLANSHFTALQRHFVTPQSWDNDIGDLLLDSTEQMGRIQDTGRLVALAASASFPPKARLVLDERMRRHPEETTRALVNTDAWLPWRRAPRDHEPARFSFRDCAANWILSGITNPKVEEWKQVVLDLHYLSADDVRVLRSRFPGIQPPWPQISLFEEEQLWDVARLCSDLGAVAELAEAVATGSPDYATVLGHSRFAGRISASALSYLSQSPHGGAHLQELHIELDEARYLAEKSGNRRTRALAVLIQAIIAVFPERVTQAEVAANEAQLWNEPAFQEQVTLWLAKRHQRTALLKDLSLLEMLNRHFEKSSIPIAPSNPRLEKLSWLYFDRDLGGLADLLQPDLQGRLVRSLLRGDARTSLWKKLIDQVNDSSGVAAEYHPLLLLAEKITTIPTLYQSRIQLQGWDVFKTICLSELPGSACFLVQHGNVLPALYLASSLRQDAGIGAVVAGILSLAGVNAFSADPKWWKALLDSMERCRTNIAQATPDRMEMAQSVLMEALQRLPELAETGIMLLEERMERYCQ